MSPAILIPMGLAQAGAAPGGGLSGLLLMMGSLFLIWWFLVIKPQRKQEAQHREFLGSLKPGARVVTTGGLHGTVAQVGEKSLKLKVADNVKVVVSRSAIASAQPSTDEGKGS